MSVWCCMAEADEVIRAADWSVRGHYCRKCGQFYPTPQALVQGLALVATGRDEARVQVPLVCDPPQGKAQGG